MWSWAKDQPPLEKLDDPPVVEVICGIHFEALPLTPVVVGGFWAERQVEFPRHQVQPAIQQRPRSMPGTPQFHVQAGMGLLRTWLLSESEALLIQVQHDRFYLNWRTRPGTSYPRFSGEHGLLNNALSEFGRFEAFCERVLRSRPSVRRVELGKVDQFNEGTAWSGVEDLASMLPILAPLLRFVEGGVAEPMVRLRDEKDDALLTLTVDATTAFLQAPVRGIKLQTIVEMPADGSDALRERFEEANACVNALFANLIPSEQRQRFMHPKGEVQ